MEDPLLPNANSQNRKNSAKQTWQINAETLKEALRIIEERIDKQTTQLKRLWQFIETMPDDEPTPTIVVTPGSIPPPPPLGPFLQRQAEGGHTTGQGNDHHATLEDERLTKFDAQRQARELADHIEILRDILSAGLKNTVLEIAKKSHPST